MIAAGLIRKPEPLPPPVAIPVTEAVASTTVVRAIDAKAANRRRAREELEISHRVAELVRSNQVTVVPGDVAFHFVTRKNKVRRMEMTPEFKAALESGELAIVEFPSPDKIEHALVPQAVAGQIMDISAKAVRFLNGVEQKIGFLQDGTEPSTASASPDVEPLEAASVASAPAVISAPPSLEGEARPLSTQASSEKFVVVRRAPKRNSPSS